MTDPKYLFIGTHPETLASGRPVEPSEPITATSVDTTDPHDEFLVSDDLLIEPTAATVAGEEPV